MAHRRYAVLTKLDLKINVCDPDIRRNIITLIFLTDSNKTMKQQRKGQVHAISIKEKRKSK